MRWRRGGQKAFRAACNAAKTVRLRGHIASVLNLPNILTLSRIFAVPLLVAIKVFCDHFEGLNNVGNFLSAQQSATDDADATDEAKPSPAN